MAQPMALIWTVKPGSEQTVEDLFSNYGRPDPVVRDQNGNVVGQLISTQVFMKDNMIVRVLEVEGDMRAVAAHLGQQPAIRNLEEQLDQYLEKPRNMSTPEGAAKFFRETMMKCLISRRFDQ